MIKTIRLIAAIFFSLVVALAHPLTVLADCRDNNAALRACGIYFVDLGGGECAPSGSGGGSLTIPTNMTLREKIAQMLVIGVTNKSTALSLVQKYKLGGIYIKKDGQAMANNNDLAQIKAAAGAIPALVSVDQEGGVVERLATINPPIGHRPNAEELAALPNEELLAEATDHGRALAERGLTMNFAPVADVVDDVTDEQYFMSKDERSFSNDPAVVTEKANEFANGMRAGGIVPVFKHFPGHGRAHNAPGEALDGTHVDGDSHFYKVVTPPLDELRTKDLVPYETILNSEVSAVMLGHLIIPDLTQGDSYEQATINPDAVDLLRSNYSFNGVIFTDEIANMDAINELYPPDQAVSLAIQAGVDMPLIDHNTAFRDSFDAQLEATITKVEQDVLAGLITEARIMESIQRIVNLKSFNQGGTPSAGLNASGNGSCCAVQSSTLIGADNPEKIWNYFVTHGLQPHHAAGIMGNMWAESGLDPAVHQGHQQLGDLPVNGVGFGLVQWTFTVRQQPLVDRATAAGVLPKDMTLQLDYVIHELQNGYDGHAGVMDQFLATTNVRDATKFIEDHYEVHAGGPQEARVTHAEIYNTQYSSNAPTASTSAGACSTNGQDGPYVLPMSREIYDANPGTWLDGHHDYAASDIGVANGAEVYSMSAGVITLTNPGGNCGRGMHIDAGDGIKFIYCHGSDAGDIPGAGNGDTVVPGQLIFHSNNTGHSTGPHLHVQIKIDDQNRCPQPLFEGIVNGTIPDIRSLPSTGCISGSL